METIRADTGKRTYYKNLIEAFGNVAYESLKDNVEYYGILVALEDKQNPGNLKPIAIVYEKGKEKDYTGKYSLKLEEYPNDILSKIKTYRPVLLIPFHTHFDFPKPSGGDIESLKEWYKHGNDPKFNKGKYRVSNFGIIINIYEKEKEFSVILFDTRGNYGYYNFSTSRG